MIGRLIRQSLGSEASASTIRTEVGSATGPSPAAAGPSPAGTPQQQTSRRWGSRRSTKEQQPPRPKPIDHQEPRGFKLRNLMQPLRAHSNDHEAAEGSDDGSTGQQQQHKHVHVELPVPINEEEDHSNKPSHQSVFVAPSDREQSDPDGLSRSSSDSHSSGGRRKELGRPNSLPGNTFRGAGHKDSVVVTENAARMYLEMNQEPLRGSDARTRRGIIHPMDHRYRVWWWITLAFAGITGWLEPYRIAFADAGISINGDPAQGVATAISLIFVAVFAIDILINFCLGYYDKHGELVMSRRRIVRHYASFQLWPDLLFTIPWDLIVLAATGNLYTHNNTTRFISLLGLLKLGRMYRINKLFRHLTYNMAISLLVSTLVRNGIYVFFLLHWAACTFYFIARQEGFGPRTWIGSNDTLFTVDGELLPPFKLYIYSFYWAVVTFDTLGYGDLTPIGLPEIIFTTLFVLVNLVVWAYILGTITLLVTKSDEAIGKYRTRMQALKEYSAANNLPKELMRSMQSLLQLYLSISGETSDETVLAPYPTTIRRRILRTLYGAPLSSCYLFKGCGQKFLDALLIGARVELFMPKTEIVSSMDHINELAIIVAGHVEIVDPSNMAGQSHKRIEPLSYKRVPVAVGGELVGEYSQGDVLQGPTGNQVLGPGDCFGEVSYFTEVPKLEAVRSVSVCRVLVVSRAVYQAVSTDFPMNAKLVLTNLQERSEELVQRYVPEDIANELLHRSRFHRGSLGSDPLHGPASSSYSSSKASNAPIASEPSRRTLARRRTTATDSKPPAPLLLSTMSIRAGSQAVAAALEGIKASSLSKESGDGDTASGLTLKQQRIISDLLRLRQLVRKAVAKLDLRQTESLLYAASNGDVDTTQSLIRQGMSPDTADYDGRTALMLASAKGHKEIVMFLLFMGADASRKSNEGHTALLAAVNSGHGEVVDVLVKHKSSLGMDSITQSATLCKAVHEGRMDALRLLLRAGANVNAGDYDGQTPLHVAAADGNLPAVKVLVEEGRADLAIRDRWEASPLDVAYKVGAVQVQRYIEGKLSEDDIRKARQKSEQERVDNMLNACYWGDTATVGKLLAHGCSVDVKDYDGRTALFVASVNGQQGVVEQLLKAGANPNLTNSFGSSPLLEACRSGHDGIIEVLVKAGASLNLPSVEEAALLSTVIHARKWDMLRRLLRAGADPAGRDFDSRTPLHIAASRGNVRALEVIAEAKADPIVQGLTSVAWGTVDRWGDTPAAEAERAGNHEAAAFLRQQMAGAAAQAQQQEQHERGLQPHGRQEQQQQQQ